MMMSEILQVSGQMLHYSKGKLVEGDGATASGVIHVHKTCIDWYVEAVIVTFFSLLLLVLKKVLSSIYRFNNDNAVFLIINLIWFFIKVYK